MAATFPSCQHSNDSDDLLSEINRRLWSTGSGSDKELLRRYWDHVYGSIHHALNERQALVRGHNKAMQTQQDRLHNAVDDYDDNDCGDKVGDPERARANMRTAQRLAHSNVVPVGAGDYKCPPMPANRPVPRTVMQRMQDGAQSVCVGGFTAGGAVVGGIGGAGTGAVVGGAAGGINGTMVAPGVGTFGGGVSGTTAGAGVGGVVGVVGGGYIGGQAGNDLGEWICR